MLTFEELKNSIMNESVKDDLIIFQYEDVPFVPYQYIKQISKIKNYSITYLDSIAHLEKNIVDIFGTSVIDDGIKVYRTEEFSSTSLDLRNQQNLYIITKKIDKSSFDLFGDYIVKIPKLEGWHIKDYVYSVAEGIDQKDLDWLIDICQLDIYKLENELDKLRLFSESERKYLFEDMKYQGAYSDLSTFNVFNITNAVTSKDVVLLQNALKEIHSFDAEPLGVVTLLYQGFRKLIQVWLAKNPTPENTGLKSNMIYAINKSPRVYNKNQLLNAFLILTNIDKQLKTGMLDTKWLIDYVICKVLTC